MFFFNNHIAYKLGRPDISNWLYLIPISVFLTGLYNAFNYWQNRNKKYRTIAVNRTIQSGSTSLSQLVIGYISNVNGLVLGGLLGSLSALFFLIKKSLSLNSSKYLFNYKKIIVNAKKYKKFPILDVPAALINLVANQAPNLLLASLFSPSVAGFYYLTQRVLQAPVTLISSSVLDVFKQRASDDYKLYGNCKYIYKKTFLLLLTMALPPSIILLIWVEDFFVWVFGDDWRAAGQYAQLLVPALFIRFIVNPLSFVIYVAEKQHINLIGMSFLCIMIGLSLFLGDTPDAAVAMISISFCSTYLFYLFISARLSKLI
jgi:O-antigen/teichoic acid export membrane protein